MKYFWVVASLGGLAANLLAQSPSISSISPGAALPGKKTEIVFSGSNLREVTGLWSSFPASTEFSADDKGGKLTCRLTLPANAPVGIGAVRVATKGGISSAQLFMVDDLPTVSSEGKNRSLQTAQLITTPVAVEGACSDGALDYYKFSAKAGQTISVEVVAQRLGSKLDPVVRLLDATGRELAYSDDDPGIGADGRFMHKFASKGEYFIEVRDINYQGGASYRYRLRVGDFPLATVPFPLAAKAGAKAEVTLGGRGVESTKPVSVLVPDKATGVLLGVKNPGGRSSGYVTLLASHDNEFSETEPNDLPDLATRVTLPAAINGRFLKPRDRDYYQFEVMKGEKLLITTKTRSLGSPSELLVQLQKADGTVLADASEGSATNTIAESGTCRLLVEDISRRGGPDQGYRVEIEPYRRFELSVESDRVDAPAGGSFSLKVTAARRDFKGAITLSVDGLEGATVTDNVIPEDKNETTVKVKIPAKMQAGDWAVFSATGRAKIKDADYAAPVSTLPALRSQFSSLPNPPLQLDGVIALGVTAPKEEEKKP